MSTVAERPSAMAALAAARKSKGATKSSDHHTLPATPELQEWAAALAEAKQAQADAEAALRAAQAAIRERVDPDRQERLLAGDYAGTVDVGTFPPIQVQYQKRFTELDEAKAESLRSIAGEHFDRLFETRRKLEVKPAIAANEARFMEMVERLQAAGIDVGLYFDFVLTVKARDTYDRDRYPLLGKERAEWLEAAGVKQTVVVLLAKGGA